MSVSVSTSVCRPPPIRSVCAQLVSALRCSLACAIAVAFDADMRLLFAGATGGQGQPTPRWHDGKAHRASAGAASRKWALGSLQGRHRRDCEMPPKLDVRCHVAQHKTSACRLRMWHSSGANPIPFYLRQLRLPHHTQTRTHIKHKHTFASLPNIYSSNTKRSHLNSRRKLTTHNFLRVSHVS